MQVGEKEVVAGWDDGILGTEVITLAVYELLLYYLFGHL